MTIENILGTPFGAARYWHRRLIDRIGPYNARYRYAHDRDYMMRCLIAGAVCVEVESVLYTYREHEGSRTLSHNTAITETFLDEHWEMAGKWLAVAPPDDRAVIYAWRRRQAVEGILLSLKNHKFGHAAARLIGRAFIDPLIPFAAFKRLCCIVVNKLKKNRSGFAGNAIKL